jgi:DNA (cytosine-5)-methyltransferase 1
MTVALRAEPARTVPARHIHKKIGEHKRGDEVTPRLFFDAAYLALYGFEAGQAIGVRFAPGRVEITLGGDRKVSGRSRNGNTIPVIDVSTKQIADAFGAIGEVTVSLTPGRIVVRPARIALKRATRCRNGKEGVLYAGGGTSSAASRLAGYAPAWAVEIDEGYAETYADNHPTAEMFVMPVTEVDPQNLAPVELLSVTLPCEPYSKARSLDRGTGAKRDASLSSAHHELAYLVMATVAIIDSLNPATIFFENVPGFLNSDAYALLANWLKANGYHVDARVIKATEYGGLTKRARAYVMATTEPYEWPAPVSRTRTLGEVLEADEDVAGEWFDFAKGEKKWLRDHWERQTAKGSGWEPEKHTPGDTSVMTIKKRYFAQQGDNPVVAHPTRPDTYRWFTLREVCRLNGLPDDYVLPPAKTVAGEIVGQGVDVTTVMRLLKATRNVN